MQLPKITILKDDLLCYPKSKTDATFVDLITRYDRFVEKEGQVPKLIVMTAKQSVRLYPNFDPTIMFMDINDVIYDINWFWRGIPVIDYYQLKMFMQF